VSPPNVAGSSPTCRSSVADRAGAPPAVVADGGAGVEQG